MACVLKRRRWRRIFIGTGWGTRCTTCTTNVCQKLYIQSSKSSHLSTKLLYLSSKLGRLSLNLFSYKLLELCRLGAWSQLEGSNGWYTTSHKKILGQSIWDIINSIFIGSTGWSSLQPQICIEFWMGWRMVLIVRCLDRIVAALGGEVLMRYFPRLFAINFCAEDWQSRHAAVLSLGIVAERCSSLKVSDYFSFSILMFCHWF